MQSKLPGCSYDFPSSVPHPLWNQDLFVLAWLLLDSWAQAILLPEPPKSGTDYKSTPFSYQYVFEVISMNSSQSKGYEG